MNLTGRCVICPAISAHATRHGVTGTLSTSWHAALWLGSGIDVHAATVGMAYDPGAVELPARRTCVWKVLLVVAAVWFWMTVYTFSLLPEQQVAAMRERAARTGTPPRHLVVLSHGMHGACARLRVPTLFVTDVLLGEQATPLQCGT